jgi:hypothetical protein
MTSHSLRDASGWLQVLRGLPRWRTNRSRGKLDGRVAAGAGALAPVPPPQSGSAPAGGRDALAPTGADRLADAHDGLRRLLDRHVATRAVWPSVALVERAMGKHGWAGVDNMSAQVLRDAAMVLARLTGSRCESGVFLLRERIAGVLSIEPGRPSMAQPLREPACPAETQVLEASFTEFMEIDREWEQNLRAADQLAAEGRYDAVDSTPGASNVATKR